MGSSTTPSRHAELWDSIFITDPRATKAYNTGRFQGTDITPMWIVRQLTRTFGPVGVGWGVKVLEEKTVDLGKEVMHQAHIGLWYYPEGRTATAPAQSDAPPAVVEAIGAAPYLKQEKNGAHVDDDAPKKSMTGALKRAASYIGFGADVHMGFHDRDAWKRKALAHYKDDDDAEVKKMQKEFPG